MTFERAFEKIKDKFKNANAAGIPDFALQITMSDDDCGGTFYAAVKNGKLAVEPYDYKDNDAVLDITKSALLAVLAGRMTIENAIKSGDAVMQGDVAVFKAWKATIKKPVKKIAPKKSTVNKTTRQKQYGKHK